MIVSNNNTNLWAIKANLTSFFTYFKDDHVLAVAEDNLSAPFMFLIVEPNHPKKVLLSIAVDYSNALNVALVTLYSSDVAKTFLTYPFYISKTNGSTYIDNEAFEKWNFESIDLEQMEPESRIKH
jgi:hypothetical protein